MSKNRKDRLRSCTLLKGLIPYLLSISRSGRGKKILVALFFLSAISLHSLAERSFELRGKIDFSDGTKPEGRLSAVVFLEGTTFPFSRNVLVGPSGKFKFKDLRQAMYRIAIYVPQSGTMEKTVEVSPSFADSKGRVERKFNFFPDRELENGATVSVTRLKIPDQALEKHREAEKALGEHDVDRAKELLKESVEIAPEYSAGWNRLGTVAFQTKQYRSARDYFRRALASEPEAYAPLVNLGGALLVLGEIEEAQEVNWKAVHRRPQDALAHSQLGQTFFVMGDLGLAERHLSRAKSLDPHHFSYPRLVLAEIYWIKQDYSAVVRELEEFLRIHPDVAFSEKLMSVLDSARKEGANQSH